MQTPTFLNYLPFRLLVATPIITLTYPYPPLGSS